MQRSILTITGIITFMFIVCFAVADTVVMKSGERKVGMAKEIKSEPDYIEFLDATGEIKIPRSRISKIDYDPVQTTYLQIGRQFFKKDNLYEARRYFNMAQKSAPDDPKVQEAMAEIDEALKDKESDQAKRQDELLEIEMKNIQQLVDDKQFEKAVEKTRFLLGVAPTEEKKSILTKQLADVYYDWGVDRMDKLDRTNAAVYLSKAFELDPSNDDAYKRLLSIWERDPAKQDDVIKIYQEKLSKEPQNYETMKKLADLLVAKNEYIEALPMLATLYQNPAYRTPEIGKSLNKAYGRYIDKLANEGKYLEAADRYEELVTLFPGTDPTPIYIYEFADKASKIDPNKMEDHLALAEFAKSKGLNDYAKREYLAVLKLDPSNAIALQEMTIHAQKALRDANNSARAGNYLVAINVAEDIKTDYPYLPNIVNQANDLIAKAEVEYKRDRREKREQAQELIRQGDEYSRKASYHQNAMLNTDRTTSIRSVSDKQEAIINYKNALRYYQTAAKLDPSTKSAANGDVANKIKQTQAQLGVMTNPVPIHMPTGASPSGNKRYN